MESSGEERFNLQPGEMVEPSKARSYGLAAEIICDWGMYLQSQDNIDQWLRELWDWAVATNEPMSDLLINDYYERRIITEEEYAHYEITKFISIELGESL